MKHTSSFLEDKIHKVHLIETIATNPLFATAVYLTTTKLRVSSLNTE